MNRNIGLRNWLIAGLLVMLLVFPASTVEASVSQEQPVTDELETNPNEESITYNLGTSISGYFYIHGRYESIEVTNDKIYIHCRIGRMRITGLKSDRIGDLGSFYTNDQFTYLEIGGSYAINYIHNYMTGYVFGYRCIYLS